MLLRRLLLPRHEHSSRLPVAAIETPAISVAAILAIVTPPVLAIPGIAGIPGIPDVAVRTLLDAIVSLVPFWPLYTIWAFALYTIGAFALYTIGAISLYPLDSILALWSFLAVVTALDALAGFATIALIVGAVDRLCVARLAIVVRRSRIYAGVALRHLVGLI